ncbi:hypothetical protein N7495_009184 [Penicillium taxi]|uniref:uncharacterized protein n=1 Tax=Penicillium taxi TaxID=168475 RepID=UPI002544F8D8|nr:uncharacterized protein N7495_009184 [Penicillium taxi]KAJ5884674.1 hypothetical protein N7495_009184 [Penicillium taxi]
MLALSLLALASACSASSLPIVDLGYERHQAISFNNKSTIGLYNFSNIRYAAPPVGDLRFRAPVLPTPNREYVQNGSVGRICPQGSTTWESDIAPEFIVSVLYNTTFEGSTNISSYEYTAAKVDPRTSEDCLFLDVVVPKKIFDRAAANSISPLLAPVLVWIYGGGFAGGDKSDDNPTGLIERSITYGDGVVYVALNYRLGAFGWLAGESIAADGTVNAGLHDQRFALNWIQENIHLFGGDKNRVTVIGESAGAGSIMHQITAYGGKVSVPFQRAILQSPGWVPTPDENQQEETLQTFLSLLNVSTIEEARKLSSKSLIEANAYQISQAVYGSFAYSPAVDGTFVPKMPGQLLLEGNFAHDLSVMVGHNADEGLLFVSPDSRTSAGLAVMLEQNFPNVKKHVTEYVTEVLYPPVYNGSYGYTNSVERTSLVISDVIFQCNTKYLNWAYDNNTFAYEFSISPAVHGQDLAYTFYNKGVASTSEFGMSNATVAYALQDYITSFAQFGVPRSSVAPSLELYGQDGDLMNLESTTIQPVIDSINNARCRFWQTAPYA